MIARRHIALVLIAASLSVAFLISGIELSRPSSDQVQRNENGNFVSSQMNGSLGTPNLSNNVTPASESNLAASNNYHQSGIKNGSDCQRLVPSSYRGVNFIETVLMDREVGGSSLAVHPPSVLIRLDTMRHAGFNVVRVPMLWESYSKNRTAFIESLDAVAAAADKTGLCVLFDNHQWQTSSYFSIGSSGGGFPYALASKYPNSLNGESEFWRDYYNNAISLNNTDIWTLQTTYLKDVVNSVDKHNSIIGYEILNEPHIYDRSQYVKLGDLQTHIATVLRNSTSKIIYFCKVETSASPDLYYADPAYEQLTKPRVNNTVFDAHQYNDPFPKFLPLYIHLASSMNVPLIIGEWAGTNRTQVDVYVADFAGNRTGWIYYAWDPIDRVYRLNDENYSATSQFQWLIKSN